MAGRQELAEGYGHHFHLRQWRLGRSHYEQAFAQLHRDDIPAPAVGGHPEDPDHREEQKRQAIAAYQATVTLIDVQVGLLMDALVELGLDQSTIVVFVSDHGFQLGEHGGLWRKHTQSEESTRAPLIVRVPGGVSGAANMTLVELVDLFPTLVDLCALPEPDGLEGTSFCPILEDPGIPWKSAIFSEAQKNGAHGRSVRTARHWRTEWIPMESAGEPDYELYDLENDPNEYLNLAGSTETGEIQSRLAAKLRVGWKGAIPGQSLSSR